MTEWKTEYCAERPEPLQQVGIELYIQRRNIHEATHTIEGEETYTDWECESREITFAEFEQERSDLRLDDIEDVLAEIIGGGEV